MSDRTVWLCLNSNRVCLEKFTWQGLPYSKEFNNIHITSRSIYLSFLKIILRKLQSMLLTQLELYYNVTTYRQSFQCFIPKYQAQPEVINCTAYLLLLSLWGTSVFTYRNNNKWTRWLWHSQAGDGFCFHWLPFCAVCCESQKGHRCPQGWKRAATGQHSPRCKGPISHSVVLQISANLSEVFKLIFCFESLWVGPG